MSKVSAANIAANRANAKLSTGPRTPEGKARSSQNARKHVFHPTSFPVVRLEEVDEVDRLRADAIAAYRPANSQETFAVERIVLAQQALLRAERLHSGIFTICLNQTVTDDSRPITAISPILVNDDYQICRAQKLQLSCRLRVRTVRLMLARLPLLISYKLAALSQLRVVPDLPRR